MNPNLISLIPDLDDLVVREVSLPEGASLMLLKRETECHGCHQMMAIAINRFGSTRCIECDEKRR